MKIDFMAHGAYEADSHYDPSVTTGVQAYNSGMAFIDSVAQGKLWINRLRRFSPPTMPTAAA